MTTAAVSVPASQNAGLGRYGVLAGAIIVQLILGTVYGYSIFWTPLQSEVFPHVITEAQAAGMDATALQSVKIVATVDEAAAVTAAQQGYLKYAFSICILSFALTMVFAGRVQDVKGPRFPAIIGATLMGAGFILAGLMQSSVVFYLAHAAFTGGVALVLLMIYHALMGNVDPEESPIVKYVPLAILGAVVTAGIITGDAYLGAQDEFDQLFLLWGTVGFLAGAGIGFAYVCPIAALVKWFPKHKGLVSGLAVAGFGFGAYLFKGDMGARGFIADHGITNFFLVHGVVCFIAVTIGAMLLRNPPAFATKPGATAAPTNDSHWQDTLKRPAFYILWLMFFSGAMAGLMVIGIVTPFVKDQVIQGGMDATDAVAVGAMAMGLLAIFNAIGRVAWGLLSDRIGRTPSFVAMFVFQAVVLFVLGTLDDKTGLYIAASLIGFNFGGNFALFPSATADLFGAKNLGANYGWVFTSYGIAGVVGIAVGNYAYQEYQSYAAAFTAAAGLCVLSAVLAVGLGLAQKRASAA